MICKEELKYRLKEIEADKLRDTIWEYIQWALKNNKEIGIWYNIEMYCREMFGVEYKYGEKR